MIGKDGISLLCEISTITDPAEICMSQKTPSRTGKGSDCGIGRISSINTNKERQHKY